MFELGIFITEEMKRKGIKKSELVKRIGYSNLSKGLRKLDGCIKEGILHDFIIQNLHTALGVEESVIQKILENTRQQILDDQEAQGRKVFRPYLFAITEFSRPTSISMAVMTGLANKKIKLPNDINRRPFINQLQFVKSVVRKNYTTNKHIWPFFGKILGYYYFHNFRENIRLNVDGNVQKDETTSFNEPEGFIVIGGKRVSGGLFKFSEKS